MSKRTKAVLEQMLACSEDHAQYWEQRCLDAERALKDIASGQLQTEPIFTTLGVLNGVEIPITYIRTISAAQVAREALQ